MKWPIADQSTSTALGLVFFVIHIFRMGLFFLIAGFFARLLHQRLGTGGLIRNRLRRIGLPLLAAMFLALPVACALISAPWWMIWMGVPVPAAGLVPNLPALLTFGIAFVLGWLIHREQSVLRSLASDWLLNLAGAVLATLAALYIAGDRVHFGLEPLPATARMAFAGVYSLALWCWCFAAIGAAVRFFDQPSSRWRYLSDASYWMYLVHLPIVWLLQAWSLRWPLPWAVKFSFVLAVTTVLLLASYHWLVRTTFVGVFLNGRRYPRSVDAVAATNQRLAI